jgi:predicted PurR-regulated permease PerM
MKDKWSPRARYFTLVIIVVFVVMAVWYIRPLFQPLIIAALFAYVLNPVVDFLEKEFSIKVEDEELIPENLDSISNVVNFLEKKLNI